MLIIKRKKGEDIVINRDIHIVVLESEKDSITLGIQSPISVFVEKKERLDEINKKLNSTQTKKEPFQQMKAHYQKIKPDSKQLENYFKSTTREK